MRVKDKADCHVLHLHNKKWQANLIGWWSVSRNKETEKPSHPTKLLADSQQLHVNH